MRCEGVVGWREATKSKSEGNDAVKSREVKEKKSGSERVMKKGNEGRDVRSGGREGVGGEKSR